MDWAYIIVIILAVILALFLLAGVALLFMIISVSRQIKHVTKSAQDTVTVFERSASQTKAITIALAFLRRSFLKMKKTKGKR